MTPLQADYRLNAKARGQVEFLVDDITNSRRMARVYLRGRQVDRVQIESRVGSSKWKVIPL
jgi:hypothetical protein